jgi:hypothetical protein
MDNRQRLIAEEPITGADGETRWWDDDQGAVTAHGSRLWADNNATGGSTFDFTLPAPAARRMM